MVVRTFQYLLLCIFSLVVLSLPAQAQRKGPIQAPMLRVETGMHTASIREISVDDACSLIVTASNDKTVRLWSLPDLKLLRIFRTPIGNGHEGKAFSVALSPKGRYVAIGGWDAQYSVDRGMRVYLFDALTGELVRRLGKFTSPIYNLTFSNDGQYLAATLGGRLGVRIWETDGWRMVGSDRKYRGDSYGAVFGPDNSLYTTSFGGTIRKYSGPDFRLVATARGKASKESFGIAIDPSGRKIAIGYHDNPYVDVYNASDLTHKFTPDTQGMTTRGSLISVAWSDDGRRLYAGGTYWDRASRTRPFRIWNNGGRGVGKNVPGTRDTIMGLQACGNELAVAASDPAFGLVTNNGRRKVSWKGSVVANMYGKRGNHFTVSDDGTRIRFGLAYQSRNPVILDVLAASLVDAPKRLTGLHRPVNYHPQIKNWDNRFVPEINKKKIKLDKHELSREISVRPGNKGIILGANWSIRSFDMFGTQLWRFQTPATVGGINVTRSGDIFVATFNDGTIRWYRVSDGKELMAFFVNAKDRRWVIWTPKGYYMASPGGEDLVGWHLNQSWNQPADFFPSSRFRDRYYRPDIVKNVLKYLDEDDAIYEANKKSRRRENKEDLRKRLPPIIHIHSPSDNSEFSEDTLSLEYSLRSPSGFDVTKVDVLLDGRPIDKKMLESYTVPEPGRVGLIRLKPPARNVKLTLIAHTKHAASEAESLELQWKGRRAPQSNGDISKPKLYALLIGVSDYKNPDYKLRYAAKDAEDFANVLKQQEGGVYREVVIKKLTNKQATAGNIRDALDWLEGEVTSRDVGLLFLAGHGVTDLKQRFYYLPHDGNPDKLRRTAIPQADIKSVISSLAGKALMFIDACHSAGSFGSEQTRGLSLVDVNGIVNELSSAENGVVMFASSTGRQLSIEDERWENGAFTEALLEGFSGKADYNQNNAISIKELDLWLSERVKELTNKRQHPVARKPPTVPDFPIAIARQ